MVLLQNRLCASNNLKNIFTFPLLEPICCSEEAIIQQYANLQRAIQPTQEPTLSSKKRLLIKKYQFNEKKYQWFFAEAKVLNLDYIFIYFIIGVHSASCSYGYIYRDGPLV